jgi:hypothetical protein
MITGNYTLPFNANWSNTALQDVYLDCDTTAAAVNITLPAISDMNRLTWNVRIHVRNASGTNAINIIADTTAPDKINNAPQVSMTVKNGSAVITVVSETQWALAETETVQIPSVVAALNQATFATAPYIAMEIGTQICVTNYNATGESCMVQKRTFNNGSFADWNVISTTAKVSTGTIGANPI